MDLSSLVNDTYDRKSRKRVGRGVGSGMGKTSTRGHKGDKSRSGYKRRYGKEGGQLPLYQKLPTRGFSNARFKVRYYGINLGQIEALFKDGDAVDATSLKQKGCPVDAYKGRVKILSDGLLTKKVTIQAHAFSKKAIEKLEETKIEYTLIS